MFEGAAYTDTLPFPRQDILTVATEVLVSGHWRIHSADTLTGRIITEWRPVRHVFVRLLFGGVRERCVVDVTPIDARRSLVRFRAALATQKSIKGHPLLPKILKEYETGVRSWQRKVRAGLVEQARARAH